MHPSPHTQLAEECFCWSERQTEERRGGGKAEQGRQGREKQGMCIGSLVCCKASSFCSGKTCVAFACLNTTQTLMGNNESTKIEGFLF